jgi:carboxypeptidase C (cathepsin A)
MLYIDQPFGVGFSDENFQLGPFSGDNEYYNVTTGTYENTNGTYDYLDVNSTVSAAANVWNLLQAFYAQFPQYENRDLGIFTESYGGHYGPGTFLPSTATSSRF